MAVPSYEDILVRWNVDSSHMKLKFSDDHKIELASKLESCTCEMLAICLGLPSSEIENIMSQRNAGVQRIRMLECWKQRCGSTATYEVLVKALLQISRTDLAEEVVALRGALVPTNQSQPCSVLSNLVMPSSPASSSGVEDMSPLGAMSPASSVDPAQDLTPVLTELEEEFYELVTFVEATLEKSEDVGINTITRRFSMLPQSIKRRQQTDENYRKTKRRILSSTTTKELFDNLTDLKHWNYMTPDILAHIVKDIKIDDIHQKIDKYKEKLSTFKNNTKLRDLIGTSFPVPDYCTEVTVEVEGWEDKTIEQAEKAVVNIMRRATYGQNVRLRWKGVVPGSTKLAFILVESIKISADNIPEAFKKSGVMSVQLDGDVLYRDEDTELKDKDYHSDMVPSGLWYETGTTDYGVGGGRDVLIIAPDQPLHNPKAVARRPGQLTQEDKLTLLSQGVSPEGQDELAVVRARCEVDKRYRIVGVKSGQLSREEVMKSIKHLLTTTKNDGASIYYIGAGGRHTGDWCFEDGCITFNDITQLYLKASSNIKGHVLTINSDCSYSGCWVRDCMEFLDEQGVQPCGHKAREKGMVIKVYTSCQSYEIPTEYRYSVSGATNDKNTGVMSSWRGKKLLTTQKTDSIDCSVLHCGSKTIDEPCTLQPLDTWKKVSAGRRIRIIRIKDKHHTKWCCILLEDNDDIQMKYRAELATGGFRDLSMYGKILAEGLGEYPPNNVTDKINVEYLTSLKF